MEVTLWDRFVPVIGLAFLVGLSLLMSSNWKLALKRWPLIAWGFGLQIAFAIFVLKSRVGAWLFSFLDSAFIALINCTYDGAGFVFGPLAMGGGPGRFATVGYVDNAVGGVPQDYDTMVFAFVVLSTIVFFSALTSILYHLNILQLLVKGFAWVMQKTLHTSGAETLSASANIFVGQTEAPLVVRPFIARMTKSELMTVMTGGFATVAGSVMGAYVTFLRDSIPDIAGHLMAASVMSAPAALMFGKLMVPETEEPETANSLNVKIEKESVNVVDAATIGTTVGVQLAINVAGMLLAFLALIALVDLLLAGTVGALFFDETPEWLTLQGMASYLFAPFAWTMGVTDWNEAQLVGRLLGEKMIANEFVAYLDLAHMEGLSVRSRTIAAYALCGFANLGSIGIQIGGLSVLAPSRRADLSRLAFRAMLAGTFAANATACIAAILL